MYKKIYEQGNKRQTGKENTHLIHLWTDEGYEKIKWDNYDYRECQKEEAEYNGLKVPEVLLSGDHAKIRKWEEEQAIKRTKERRPDLLSG